MFYYSHRLLHTSALYSLVHKKHHELTAPFALGAAYAHWFEFLVGNVLPLMVGPLVRRSHVVTTWLWLSAAVVVTQLHHCGYAFPVVDMDHVVTHQPHFHDQHHKCPHSNYGLLRVLDVMHGTAAPCEKCQGLTTSSHIE